jgi:hypothetical protein
MAPVFFVMFGLIGVTEALICVLIYEGDFMSVKDVIGMAPRFLKFSY